MTNKISTLQTVGSIFLFLFVFNFPIALGQPEISSPSEIKLPYAMSVSVPLRELPSDTSPIKTAWFDGIIPVRKTTKNQIFGTTEDGVLQNYNGQFNPSDISVNFDGVGAQGFCST